MLVPAAHRQCARDANSLGPEDGKAYQHANTPVSQADCYSEPENWRCSNCVENDLQPDVKQTGMASTRRRSSAPKITRDLLPAHRGAMKPDSHSVFNTLILDDDPMDGSRSLRKRKASDETAPIRRPERKRRRPSDSAAESDGEIAVASSASPNTARVVVAEAPGDDTKEAPTDEDSSPKLRRTRRIRQSHKPLVTFVDGGLRIVSFNLDPVRLQAILSQKPRKKRSNRDKRKILAQPQIIADNEPSHYPAIQSTYMQSLFLNDRESDELKKPYGGILSENEADTSKTFPEKADRERFERARLEAETMWKKKTAAQIAIELAKPTPKTSGTPSKMKAIYFGGYEIDIWHTAPYPEEYNRNRLNYICEFCLRYHPSDYVAWRHKVRCQC